MVEITVQTKMWSIRDRVEIETHRIILKAEKKGKCGKLIHKAF